jgi:hypothetical protein
VNFTSGAAGATFTNSASVIGANGDAGGNGAFGGTNNINFGSDGSGAAGRVGIVGTDLTIINSGTITGGLANAGAGAQANAITFTGGTNTLQIQAGSTINGNVVAFSAADTFVLGGTTNSTLNATLIGTRYQGFGVFDKTGTSTWTLNGGAPGQASKPWVISGGILKAGNAAGVFGATSAITLTSPGTLDLGGFVQTIGTLSGSGTVTNNGVSNAALTNGDSSSTIFSGMIQDGSKTIALTN